MELEKRIEDLDRETEYYRELEKQLADRNQDWVLG